MATKVKIPPMGESVTRGLLSAWHVQDGDYVRGGQPLFVLETDKATAEGSAQLDGVIRLKVAEGTEVEAGQTIAVIENELPPPEADVSAIPEEESAGLPGQAAETPSGEEPEAPVPQEKPKPVSPAVRRLAHETGIHPGKIKGTGKGGRVTKADFLLHAAQKTPPKQEATIKMDIQDTETIGNESAPADSEPKSPSGVPPQGKTSRKKMSPLRQSLGERLARAQCEAAILTTFNEADLGAIRTWRARHQDGFTARHGVPLGIMPFFVKAAVYALKEVPALNAQIDGGEIVQNHYYDIAVAVSTDQGLTVPVLRGCDKAGFGEIARDIRSLAERARGGGLSPEDLQGGVFTISNGGIYGSMLSTPLLNSPQSGILGLHAIQDRPVARGGQVVIRPMMYLALSYDHRVADGREAVAFLVKIKEAVEDPARLLLEV